ncbi:hypothetical protein DAPPUDRAFT_346480 [Daphnia pulex]|uniref:Uncharacterized protein n=1 Tax=Daphnia pulex TaxID=6669 RepID=E9I7X3_DAPPU|nr:hypothetical protein DAPPUDRAFT_346480 [Daphnia pulex]|eukprot:EFX59907.1 hypothetical protein DAPPUDRAFT_346480 [Daphnia pulex]
MPVRLQGGCSMFPEVIADVEKYIASRPNFSREKFAALGKISDRTVYRFLAGEQVSQKSFIAILKVIHGSNHGEVLKQLVEKYPGNKDLQKSADFYKTMRLSFDVDDDLKQFFCRDGLTYQIYLLLTYEDGVSRGIVHDEFGKMGLKLFDELLSKSKLVEVKPGCYRLANHRQGFFEGGILKTLAGRVFELYDADTFGTQDSQLTHMSGWVSEEGFAEIKDVALKAGLRFMDIENKYPGSIPFSLATGLIKIRDDINFQKNSEGLS